MSYNQKENSYSPSRYTSPSKNTSLGSPPLKRPRDPTLYSDYDPSYKPQSREEILGTPIEIIKGKCLTNQSESCSHFLTFMFLTFYFRETLLDQ